MWSCQAHKRRACRPKTVKIKLPRRQQWLTKPKTNEREFHLLYAFAKQVSLTTLFRYALKEFAEITFPDPVADAEFDAMEAKFQAQQSIADLPKLSGGWVN
jgi:hypothetical protein